ncbi:unnamed protein product [Oppiella nova]|uniref:Uncharacterized protein n=1 Tax=Oppiella nova TaxID=334625 RepID=A0A7R9QYH7_9ACAR|nr:unnamed protein product [Oppiella nova]CAG2179023.1 unnamed protein product [Oppiella nova]
MYFQTIVVCIAIQAVVSTPITTKNADITAAGKHILERINQARESKYSVIQYYNMNITEVNENADKIIKIFMDVSKDFQTESCLRLEEQDMGRFVNNNCYAQVSRIVSDSYLAYEVTIGETAYAVTDYDQFSVNHSKKFEFYLGPLFFGVYELKP